MEPQYVYVKARSQFGKRCYFSECEKLEVDIKSDPTLAKDYVHLDPISRSTECRKEYAAHEVNTTTAVFKNSGMLHVEGGWPRDVNKDDQEQTIRYRRKIEKDELYVHTLLQLLPQMEHCVLQNNGCNIYQQYFEDTEATDLVERTFCRTLNVYRDPLPVKRPISHISWSPDHGSKLAVSYSSIDFKKLVDYSPVSYIWNVDNPNKPLLALEPFCPMLVLEYNPKDSNILASGLLTGQVAIWDIRKSVTPVSMSPEEISHRDPCSKVLWINSKIGTEFFSASRDGQIKWWDTRKLKVPLETLVIDLEKPDEQDLDRAIGVSALQFETSVGTRFMCGLENGVVISGNRKGKLASEKIAQRYKAQYGAVLSVERNPTFLKNFLSVGDWTARIWSEDCREGSIMWTPNYGVLLTCGVWSSKKYSVFFLSKIDGTLDVWDLLVQQDMPVLSVKVCDEALTCMKTHEGPLLAVGSRNGSVYMLEFSKSLIHNYKNDKILLTALFDRESRREKVIEAKNREYRLKLKTIRQESEVEVVVKRPIGDLKDPIIQQCEKDYQLIINDELARQTALQQEEVCRSPLDT